MMRLFSFPAIALVCALILRGLSAPLAQSHVKADEATEAPQNQSGGELEGTSPYFSFARQSFDEGVRSAVNARAVFLFHRAQQEANALPWLEAYTRKVAGDVAALRRSLGSPTGEASQFSEVLNRSAELAAASLALTWLQDGGIDYSKSAVDLSGILQTYGEVFGNDDQPEG